MVDWICKERQLLYGSVHDLTFHHDVYMHKVKRASIYITKRGDALSAFNFSGSLV